MKYYVPDEFDVVIESQREKFKKKYGYKPKKSDLLKRIAVKIELDEIRIL